MATATIVSVTQDATNAYAWARVAEGGAMGNIEYSASTPLKDSAGNAKSAAQIKSDLTAALVSVRNAQVNPSQSALGGITGTLTL